MGNVQTKIHCYNFKLVKRSPHVLFPFGPDHRMSVELLNLLPALARHVQECSAVSHVHHHNISGQVLSCLL